MLITIYLLSLLVMAEEIEFRETLRFSRRSSSFQPHVAMLDKFGGVTKMGDSTVSCPEFDLYFLGAFQECFNFISFTKVAPSTYFYGVESTCCWLFLHILGCHFFQNTTQKAPW